MKIRYSAVRHNISVGNDGCVSVLFHTEQNYSSPIFSTHIKALTGWNGNMVNRAVRHNISVGNDGCVSVLSHTGQNISSLIISTHIQALTGWISNKVNRIGNIVNRAVRHNISVEKKQRFMLSRPGQNMEHVFGSTNIETLTG